MDFEANDGMLADKDIIFIGRPEDNSELAAWRNKIGLDYQGAVFNVNEKRYASERDSLVYTGTNPLNAHHMVLVYAGNSPLETARSTRFTGKPEAEKVAIVLYDGKSADDEPTRQPE
jgi:hypothetical protein